jgi:uncharacterized Zn finger protein (UPF0148 family)
MSLSCFPWVRPFLPFAHYILTRRLPLFFRLKRTGPILCLRRQEEEEVEEEEEEEEEKEEEREQEQEEMEEEELEEEEEEEEACLSVPPLPLTNTILVMFASHMR